jgi:NADH:ubiquinone oxidoreductase subunit 3 (subunit A)
LGDFEVLLNYASVLLLGTVIYNVINIISFRDLIKRFGFTKISRRDYYECGFKPQQQRPIKLPIQFLLITIFFLMYDVEFVFIFPYASSLMFNGLFDFILILFFFLFFLLSLIIDYDRHALY